MLAYGFPQVPVEVDEALLKELEEMGFTTNRAKRALHGSGNSTIEGAINWITEHEADADIDEPLMVRKVWHWEAGNSGSWGM
jgi:uncharacterized UBP type Zn finger protein